MLSQVQRRREENAVRNSSSFLRSMRLVAAVLFLCLAPASAWAAVEISFYSRELGGNNFPHAFVTLKGQPDSGGPPVDISYGFTAKTVTPAILLGSVGGKVVNEPPSYVAKSDKQFSLVLSDDRFNAVMAVVERWANKRQPSYNLNRANCVHFVGEIAQAAGLNVTFRRNLMKKPRSFLLALRSDNQSLISAEAPPATR